MSKSVKPSGEGVLVTQLIFEPPESTQVKEDYPRKTFAAPLLAGVLGAIFPVVIEKVLDWLGKRFNEEIQELIGTTSAMGVSELYYPNPKVHKWFKPESVTFLNQRVGVEIPDLKALFTFKTATDRSAFRLELTKIEFNATSAKKIGDKNCKDILFAGIFELPYADIEAEDARKQAKFGAFQVALRDVALKTSEEFERPLTTQWIPLPANREKKNSEEHLTRPFSLLMTAVEAEEAGDLVLLARDIFSESKDTLKEELTDLIKNALRSDEEAG